MRQFGSGNYLKKLRYALELFETQVGEAENFVRKAMRKNDIVWATLGEGDALEEALRE